MARAVWKSPIPPVVERYRRLMGRRHLDVGPGTGYFLERSAPSEETEITLLDPNPNVLRKASRRLAASSRPSTGPATSTTSGTQPKGCAGSWRSRSRESRSTWLDRPRTSPLRDHARRTLIHQVEAAADTHDPDPSSCRFLERALDAHEASSVTADLPPSRLLLETRGPTYWTPIDERP